MKESYIILDGDCIEHMKGAIRVADYIFTVPPDLDELGLDARKSSDRKKYWSFLEVALYRMTTISNIITIGITDRKASGGIIPKHHFVITFFQMKGWRFLSHKIWVKSKKINLYRPTFTHIMTFTNDKNLKQFECKSYLRDVFYSKERKYEGFGYGMNVSVVAPFILRFTNENYVVYDPFMGSGTTALAALFYNRSFIGSEIDPKTSFLAKERIRKFWQSGKIILGIEGDEEWEDN